MDEETEPCSTYDWFKMMKSKFVMWAVLVEAGQYEYKCRREEELLEDQESDDESGGPSPTKPDQVISGVKIPDSAARALKLAIRTNTNTSGGGPKFKNFLDKARSDCRLLTKPIERALKVFKANSSGKSKAILKEILLSNNRGGIVTEVETNQRTKSVAAYAYVDAETGEDVDVEIDEGIKEESAESEVETAENTAEEDSDPEAEISSEEEDEGDEDFEDHGYLAPPPEKKKKGPPPRDKVKDAKKLDEIMTCADPDKSNSIMTDNFLGLLIGKDLDTLHAMITKTFRSFWTAADLLQHVTAFEVLSTQIPRALLDSFLIPSYDFGSISPLDKVKCLKALCDFQLIHDEVVQEELRLFDKCELSWAPNYFDAYGRAYFFFRHLQPLAGCRFYRSVGSWNLEGGNKKKITIKESSKSRFRPEPLPPNSTLPAIPREHDRCTLWEVCAEDVDELDALLEDKASFNGTETTLLKKDLKETKADLEEEAKRVDGHIARERRKEILRNMPRRTSSRARSDEVNYNC